MKREYGSFLLLLALLLAACSAGNDGTEATSAAVTMSAAVAETSVALQTLTAEAEETRLADLDVAIETAIAGTAEADEVQAAVAATQEAAFTPTPRPQLTCIEIAQDYLTNTLPDLTRWLDAAKIAGSTARVSLAGPLGELQAIRRDVDNIEPPTCMTRAHNSLVRHMDHTIEAFLLFMQDAPQTQINAEFQVANDAMENFTQLLQDVQLEATRETIDAARTPTPVK